ncbi:hypothetical protein MHYP_G00255540 [Metynnis hypsauchen]
MKYLQLEGQFGSLLTTEREDTVGLITQPVHLSAVYKDHTVLRQGLSSQQLGVGSIKDHICDQCSTLSLLRRSSHRVSGHAMYRTH